MGPYIIRNPVPTPEEMAEILGLSSDRVDAVRKIMNTPVRKKPSSVNNTAGQAGAQKKSSRTPINQSISKG